MKVLFIYPVPPPEFQEIGIQQGIAINSAVLKKEGHTTSLIIFNRLQREFIDEEIRRFTPDLIAISSTTNQFDRGRELVRFLGEGPGRGAPIIIGGVHATLFPSEVIELPGILGLCRGEGEYPLLELVDAMEHGRDFTGIRNLWIKVRDKVVRNDPRPFIKDLDSLPFPDREIFSGSPLGLRTGYLEFLGGRGCPHNCTNCFHAGCKSIHFNDKDYVRFKSPEYLVREIKRALEDFPGFREIGFHDASLTTDREWTIRFCRLYEEEVGIPFWCNSRADTLDEELIETMKRAGCFEMHIGIESGNEELRNAILCKGVTGSVVERAFSMLRNAGMKTWSFNMVGLPWETEERIWETILFNRRLSPDRIFCSVFAPYPGTYLWDVCREKGWLSGRKVESYFDHTSTLDLPHIPHRRVSFYHDIFKFAIRYPKFLPLWTIFHFIPINGKFTMNDGLRFLSRWARGLKDL